MSVPQQVLQMQEVTSEVEVACDGPTAVTTSALPPPAPPAPAESFVVESWAQPSAEIAAEGAAETTVSTNVTPVIVAEMSTESQTPSAAVVQRPPELADVDQLTEGRPADVDQLTEGSQSLNFFRRLIRLPQPLHVRYPLRFKALAAVVAIISFLWVVHFLSEVLPWTRKPLDPVCQYYYEQLGQNGILLFVYFTCFAQVRVAIFVPRIAGRVADLSSRRRNPCHMYCVHMLVHGALYFFSIGSVLYWCQLLQSPYCHDVHKEQHAVLTRYAMFSCLVSISCLWLVYWHTRLLTVAMREQQINARRAPPNTIRALKSIAYDPHLFGPEDGKMYPAECPICLSDWEDDQTIKITPCEHVFHEDCLGMWLSSQRTCAVCRHDLTKPMIAVRSRSPRAKSDVMSPQSTQSEQGPQVVGAQTTLDPAARP